jgi:hypothetical protein
MLLGVSAHLVVRGRTRPALLQRIFQRPPTAPEISFSERYASAQPLCAFLASIQKRTKKIKRLCKLLLMSTSTPLKFSKLDLSTGQPLSQIKRVASRSSDSENFPFDWEK